MVCSNEATRLLEVLVGRMAAELRRECHVVAESLSHAATRRA